MTQEKHQWKVAVVGATGLVGSRMLAVLEKRNFPISELVPVASPRSAGKEIPFRGEARKVRAIAPEVFDGVDIALFSAGGGTSREWAEVAAKRGATVIDNSSAWRMDPEVPLCVPEVNLEAARKPPKGIIANPNCSTIQLVTALAPIHRENPIVRLNVATYQAISGAGATAVESFQQQMREYAAGQAVQKGSLPGQLAGNLLMAWSTIGDTGYHEEEMKLVNETRKILAAPTLSVSPTAVRVPVLNGHSEAVTVECERPLTAKDARRLLTGAPGLRLMDDFDNGIYPTPLDADGTDEVLVGRIRDDIGRPGGIQLWIVGDNLLKGAALNAVQIAEGLFSAP
ncbi:MAG: aspartate-semialdehyde dehydrogenase [Myxococcales bacterium]|nr:aspartate-semialdehyde dehydrogenase [Myxococcales bacterium]